MIFAIFMIASYVGDQESAINVAIVYFVFLMIIWALIGAPWRDASEFDWMI